MNLFLAEIPKIVKRLKNGGVTVSLSPNSPQGVIFSGDPQKTERARQLVSPVMADFVSLLAEWKEIERVHQTSVNALSILEGFEARGVSFNVSASGKLSVAGGADMRDEVEHNRNAIILAWFERDEREAIQTEANGHEVR